MFEQIMKNRLPPPPKKKTNKKQKTKTKQSINLLFPGLIITEVNDIK